MRACVSWFPSSSSYIEKRRRPQEEEKEERKVGMKIHVFTL